MAVHSAKDMPMEFPEGLCIGAVLEREEAADVLVTLDGTPAEKLPAGSVIGTSSLRRQLQIHSLNPGVEIKLLRGNVQTRIEKLRRGGYDGILLAAAGLARLGLDGRRGFIWSIWISTALFRPLVRESWRQRCAGRIWKRAAGWKKF